MSKKLFNFHHFGLALKNPTVAIEFYKNIGYRIGPKFIDKDQNVKLILCTSKLKPNIELVIPISTNSPIANYLVRFDQAFYHTCYEINDLRAINFLKKKFNAKCVLSPRPSKIFNCRNVSFYYINKLGLIEII